MKRYYTKDIERILQIKRRTLFNWIKAKKVPTPKREPMSGYRFWTDRDLKRLKKITGK